MSQEFEQRRARDFKELVRRAGALREQLQKGSDGTIRGTVPSRDPTGLLEYAEAARRTQIEHSRSVLEKFPHFESVYPALPPWKQDAQRAYEVYEAVLAKANDYVKGLTRGEDYETFPDPVGELLAYHFKTADELGRFRLAVGLDEKTGYEGLLAELFPKSPG